MTLTPAHVHNNTFAALPEAAQALYPSNTSQETT
jgi:hypothetical protein